MRLIQAPATSLLLIVICCASMAYAQDDEGPKTLSQQAVDAVYEIWALDQPYVMEESHSDLDYVLESREEYSEIARTLDDLIKRNPDAPLDQVSKVAHIRDLARLAAEVMDQVARGDSGRFRRSNQYVKPLGRAINKRVRQLEGESYGSDAHRELLLNEYGYDIGPPMVGDGLSYHWAARLGAVDQVKAMLDAGTEPDAPDDGGRTAMFFACKEGHLEVVRLLVESGADVNHAIGNGTTPLYVASIWGHIEIVELLMDNGADIQQEDKFGRTALSFAATYGRWSTVKTLIEHGADVNANVHDSGMTPLSCAAARGHTGVVRLLLEHGADASILDEEGQIPSKIAKEAGYLEIAAFIENYKATPAESP